MSEVRLIDANALKYKNLAEVNGRLTYVLTAEEIDNAPTVPQITICCENADEKTIEELKAELERVINEVRPPQGEWLRKEDVINHIAKQYSEHNEIVPIWLSIADMRGKEE